MALYCHFAFLTLCVICCRVAQYVGENIEPAISITPLGLSVHGARSIYIYRLAPCTENCSQKISKTFSHNNLEDVLLFCTFEPKKCKCAFRVAVSACTLKILCCGYNMATIKKDKKIKDYDTRSCSEMVIFLSFRRMYEESTARGAISPSCLIQVSGWPIACPVLYRVPAAGRSSFRLFRQPFEHAPCAFPIPAEPCRIRRYTAFSSKFVSAMAA